MSDIKKVEAKISELENALAAAREKHKNLLSEDPEQQLARELHELLCAWNHTDGCSWFYESKNGREDWGAYAHGEYLGKARKVMMYCNKNAIATEQAIEIFKAIKGA